MIAFTGLNILINLLVMCYQTSKSIIQKAKSIYSIIKNKLKKSKIKSASLEQKKNSKLNASSMNNDKKALPETFEIDY